MLSKIKVLLVDDSALMRRVIKEILITDSEIEIVGAARDGEDAVQKVRELRPDVVTMDINMPVMDGLTSMQYILNDFPDIPVIILSSLTTAGALTTFEALELGAFDYIGKPSGTVSADLHIIGREIIQKVKAAYKSSRKNRLKRKIHESKRTIVETVSCLEKSNPRNSVSKVVVIGISTGGPNTLMEIVPHIPSNLKASIIIVQHMPPTFTSTFAKRIDSASPFRFKEAEAGDAIVDGQGFVVPGGYHFISRENKYKGGHIVRLTEEPKTLFIPSVNIVMESALECFGAKKTIGVIMTGMGDDGADAMVKIRKAGGVTIAQDEKTSTIFGMPKEAIERGGAGIVVPSYRIPQEIIRAVNN
ncbi:protein-glutamate methylesterase/protein-glutamine glutaminase [Clostridium cylindrosporum]|uniref:Protein-glutamate methylesterase/protein-glutamine glutaminase n=1 Tax=Clostridium cylindrosporum DSM 605 TaxID=1121307 RepID=A0A0J8G2T8_CLOCY|nr:chemotaxis response regulator protein-glutamate methylesterase [Clostridium cylindrosporum]KMT22006.1 chemotaxis response regulator protein-glutamate methylesterase CheB [Clostridium cylindrosporum DSM 605]